MAELKFGSFNLKFGKTYRELDRMIASEKKGRVGDSKTEPTRQLSEYKSWASSATSLISRSSSIIPFNFYRVDTNEEINSRIHGYNIFTKPFLKPNPLMSMRWIKAWVQIQWDMCGMGAIYKARNFLGQTTELWPLNMNDFLGAYDSQGRPIETCSDILPTDVFYVFLIGGKYFKFSINELILLMHPHPKYQFIGASPIQCQAYALDIQTYVEIYERDFFANSARIDMALITDDELGTTKAEDIKQRWLEKFRGNFHDIAVLDKGLKPFPLNFMNKDFEFLELAKWSRDLVLSAYGINPSKLGITDGVTRSDGVNINVDFNRDVIQPRLVVWDEEFTQITQEYNQNIKVVHDNPIPRDRLIEVQEERVYLGGAGSKKINEARKDKKLPPDPNGDEILVSTKFIPLSLLKKYWEAQIKNLKNPPTNSNGGDPKTDPTRHDDDKPHTNPDGSDDRDDNPTDQRSFEKGIRDIWEVKILDHVKNNSNYINYHELFKGLLLSTVNIYLSMNNHSNLKCMWSITDVGRTWIEIYVGKVSEEFKKTIESNLGSIDDYVEDFKIQMSINPRIAKICNSAIRSCINYSRMLILDFHGLEKKWIIENNLCGHKGRVKEFTTKNNFIVGNQEVKFPGELFNLNCDCLLDIDTKLITGN